MVADSTTDSELFHGSPISRDFVKKRKANWLWKLKQWKTNARRKQWTSLWKRANNVGEEENGFRLKSLRDRKTVSERFSYIREWRIDDDDDDGSETDLERASSASSPTSVLKSKDSLSRSSGEDCYCCSKPVPEEEDEAFDDALENFDGLRDALNSSENKGTKLEQEVAKPSKSHRKKKKKKKSTATNLLQKEKPEEGTSTEMAVQVQNKKKSTAKNLLQKEKCHEGSSTEKAVQGQSNEMKSDQQQKPEENRLCPVCCEAMDETDLNFLPCHCGFLVCLFCHKQINENDGKCPQCRGKYDQTSTNNSGEVSFQQPGGAKLKLSSSFKGLDEA